MGCGSVDRDALTPTRIGSQRGVTMKMRDMALPVLSLFVVASLAGCSGEPERDTTATAKLDFKRLQVIVPTTEYSVSPELQQKMLITDALMMRPCIKEHGFVEPMPKANAIGEMRIWGLWSVDSARKHGQHLANEPSSLSFPKAPEYGKAREVCWPSIREEQDSLYGSQLDSLNSKATEINFRAHDTAKNTTDYKQAKDEYNNCLREKGLKPNDDMDIWGSTDNGFDVDATKYPSSEETRTAVAEAQCNSDLNITQRMGDLEASIQAPLVRENQAVLNQEKEEIQQLESRVDEYIRTHQ